jgi:plasmid replication initiation protein
MNQLSNRNIVVSGSLVAARYSLSVAEHIVILIVLGKLDQSLNIENNKSFYVSVDEYCEIRNVDRSVAFKQLKQAADTLFERELLYQELDEKEQLFNVRSRWVSSCSYDVDKKGIKIKFVPEILKHLIELKSNYATLRLSEFGKLNSNYTMRILQLLCLNRFQGKKGSYEIELDELLFMLEVPDSYNTYAMFKMRVLKPTIKELGEVGKKIVNIKLVEKKIGKKVAKLQFNYCFIE